MMWSQIVGGKFVKCARVVNAGSLTKRIVYAMHVY